jgi:hypothetical protein
MSANSTGPLKVTIGPSSNSATLQKFFVRWKRAIGNHVFCALRAFLKLEEKRSRGLIGSWYELKRHLIDQAVGDFIQQMAGQHSA